MITIVIPTYNRLELMLEAYKSVLGQDSSEYSLVIIDDSTNDETQKYFADKKLNPNVTYIKNPKNLGIVENLSKSFSIAKTKWVTMLSDDDYLEKNFVSESIKTLSNSNKAIVIASFRDVNEHRENLREYKHKKAQFSNVDAFIELFYDRCPTAGGSGFFLNTHLCGDILRLKNYPNALLSDSYMCMAAAKIGGMETIDTIIYNRRKWTGSLSSGGNSIKQKLKAIKASYSSQRMFRKDLLGMWERLAKENKENQALLDLKHDLDAYYGSNAIYSIFKHKFNKIVSRY